MHHSGLFDEWRMPIATGIAWFHDCDGGALAYWPDGADGPPATHAAQYNTAMVLDTDTRVPRRRPHRGGRRRRSPAAPTRHGARPGRRPTQWTVHAPTSDPVARYDWDELRFSVSWKAYCFRDEAERDAWRDHADDLTLDARRRPPRRRPRRARQRRRATSTRNPELGLLMIDEYIRFPAPQALVLHPAHTALAQRGVLDRLDLVLQPVGHTGAVVDLDHDAHARRRLRDLHHARADERHHLVVLALDVREHRVGLVRQPALAHDPHHLRDLRTHGLAHTDR